MATKMVPSEIEKFLDSILLGSQISFLISCPDAYAQKFSKFITVYSQTEIIRDAEGIFIISDAKLNFYYSLFACICLILVLALNRKRYIQGTALRLFTNYYLGILFGQTFLNLLVNFFKVFIPAGSKNGLCIAIIPYYDIAFVGTRETSLSRLQIYTLTISTIFNSLAYHLLPIYLILHRFITYFACAYPIAFKRYFSIKRMMVYYPVIGLIFFAYHVTCNIIALKTQRAYEWWDPFDNGFSYKKYEYINEIATTIFVLMHLVITVACIYTILTYNNYAQNEVKELRRFLGFSIGPTAISIIFQCISFADGTSWVYDDRNTFGARQTPFLTMISTIETLLLIIFQPLYTCILYIIFVPFYRKCFYRLFFCCKSTNVQIHPVIILSVSRNI